MQHLVTILRQDRLRMKLHAHHRMGAVSDPHDLTIIGARGDLETIAQGRLLNQQRVIARRLKGRWNLAEEALPLMRNH